MNKKYLIIITGIIYSVFVSLVFDLGFCMFGIAATIGALWLRKIIRKQNIKLKDFIVREAFPVTIVTVTVVGNGLISTMISLEAFCHFLAMVPAMFLFGLPWLIVSHNFIKKSIFD